MIIVACPCSQPGDVTQPHASPAKLPNPEHAGALLDGARLDELAQHGFGDTDVAADADEPDAPLCYQAAGNRGTVPSSSAA